MVCVRNEDKKVNKMEVLFVLVFIVSSLQISVTEDPQLVVLVTDLGTRGIYKMEIHEFTIQRMNVAVVGPLAIDYDKRDGLIYFTDIVTKQIRRVDLDGNNDTEVATFNSSSSPDGLTLDGDSRLVFYTDNGTKVIGSVNMDTFDHKIIIDSGVDQPRGIVADTKNKKLYWVDYGIDRKIESSDYNGDQRTVVISSLLAVPMDITLDQEAGRLYFTDGRGSIGAVDVDGGNGTTIAVHSRKILNVLSFFNDFLYYTALTSQSIFISPLESDHYFIFSPPFLQKIGGIHVFSPNFERTVKCQAGFYGRNCVQCGNCDDNLLCEKTTGVCVHGCNPGYTGIHCNEECPPGTFGRKCQSNCNCIRNGVCEAVTGRCFDGCAIGWKGDNCSIACDPGTFGEHCRSKCPTSCKENTICDYISGKCPLGCKSGWKGDHCTEADGLHIGDIVGIVVGVILFIIVVVVLIVFAVYLIRKRNSNENQGAVSYGMQFESSVYEKAS